MLSDVPLNEYYKRHADLAVEAAFDPGLTMIRRLLMSR